MFKRIHGIIKAAQIEISNAKIGVGLGGGKESDGVAQDFDCLGVLAHENVNATQTAIAVGIVGSEGNGALELVCRFRISRLVGVKTA